MKPSRVAIVGWGHLGAACAETLRGQPDLALAGVVQPPEPPPALALPKGVTCAGHVSELDSVDLALLCVPTDRATDAAHDLLQRGLPVVECASLEADSLHHHRQALARAAARHRAVAALGAGWDPGLLQQLVRVFELLVPKGSTRVNRHTATGLYHPAAVESVPGVQEALSTEIRDASGHPQRYVYVQLAPGAQFERVRSRIEGDPLFNDEPTQVLEVDDLASMQKENSGIVLQRLGSGGPGPHASLVFEARADATAFTARLMVDAARLLRALPPSARGAWLYTPFGLVPWTPEP